MTKDELNLIITKVRNSTADEGALSESLLELQTNVLKEIDTGEKLASELASTKQRNETLLEHNMKLFLKVGDIDAKPTEQTEQALKFSDLFNEKGGLK